VPVTGREAAIELSGKRNPVPPDAAALARGKVLFSINCALCHGASSSSPGLVGRKHTPPPPGLGHTMVQGLSDAEIFQALTLGLGRMPSFRDKLTPGERWSLVDFLRTRD
jgi:mono/diheme cytochrome c family protein